MGSTIRIISIDVNVWNGLKSLLLKIQFIIKWIRYDVDIFEKLTGKQLQGY